METAFIRAHKSVIEEVIGLHLEILINNRNKNNYILLDADFKFIKKFYTLAEIVRFISTIFGYSYIDLDDLIRLEKKRLLKENTDVLKSATVRFDRIIDKPLEKLKLAADDLSQPQIKNGKIRKSKYIKCPYCKYVKCETFKISKLQTEYYCLNCNSMHFRDTLNEVLNTTRSKANRDSAHKLRKKQ